MELPPDFLKDKHGLDFIIAADGGAQHCISLGVTPDVIIGDFDSLEPDTLTAFQHAGIDQISCSQG